MGVKISELPAAPGAVPTMQFEANNGGVSQRVTLAQMFALSTAVSVDTPLLNMTQTWNGGVTFTGWKLNVTDTVSAADSKLLDLQLGGSSKLSVLKTGRVSWNGQPGTGIDTAAANNHLDFWCNNGQVMRLSGGFPREVRFGLTTRVGWGIGFDTLDTVLERDSSNALALRNGTNGQYFAVYGTYADAGNWERVYLQSNGGGHYLFGASVGTGVPHFLEFGTNNTGRWRIGATDGHWLASTDNTYDIGASGANRPRNVFVAGYLNVGAVATGILAGDISAARNDASGVIYLGSDGQCYIYRDSGTKLVFGGYTSLQLAAVCQMGGTTASFPAFKRSAAELHVRLADDSDFATIRGRLSTHAAAVAETITPNSTLTLFDSNGTAYKVPCVAA